MYLGIDLGTSAVKIVLVDDAQRVMASESRPLDGPRRRIQAIASRTRRSGSKRRSRRWTRLKAITRASWRRSRASDCPARCTARRCSTRATSRCGPAFSGTTDAPLRNVVDPGASAGPPCGRRRATRRCRDSPRRSCSGSRAHEPEIFAATKLVLQPKAYLRLVLTRRGDRGRLGRIGFAVARCCAPGLVGRGARSDRPVARCRCRVWSRAARRRHAAQRAGAALGHDRTADDRGRCRRQSGGSRRHRRDQARRSVRVARNLRRIAGADRERIAANPDRAVVHTFCHAVPDMWIQAGAILSAASCLAWIARLFGTTEAELLAPLGVAPAGAVAGELPAVSRGRTDTARRSRRARHARWSQPRAPIATRSCRRCSKASPSRLRIAGTRSRRPALAIDGSGCHRRRLAVAVLALRCWQTC